MTMPEEASTSGPLAIWIFVAIWSLSMIWIASITGAQHDHVHYLAQWDLVLSRANPWSTDNAYGPLHNVLAYLLALGPSAPKMLIVGLLLVANILLVWELHRFCGGGSSSLYGIYLLAIPTNVLVVGMTFVYGLNDALVAALAVFALVARHRGALVVAGCLLGLAVLLKYYPIVLVPLFALDAGRVRVRLILAAAAVAVAGMAAAELVWGDAVFRSIAFAADRQPTLLSVLSAVSSYPALVGGQRVVDFLIRTNIVIVATVASLSVFIAWKAKMHWLEASVLGLLAVLVAYKVGHQQFYLPWLFLVAALPLAATPSSRRLACVCLPMVLFLSAFHWGYAYGTDRYREVLGTVRTHVGFFTFALGVATIAVYFGERRMIERERGPGR